MNNKKIPKGWKIVTYNDFSSNNSDDSKQHSNDCSNNDSTNSSGHNYNCSHDNYDCSDHSSFKDSSFDYSENKSTYNQHLNGKKSKTFRPLIWGDLSSKPFWKRNLFPVFLEAAFLISCFSFPKEFVIYSTFIFYAVLFLYFLFTKSFSFHNLFRNLTSGFYFWKETLIAGFIFGLAFVGTGALEHFFPNLNPGFFQYPATNIPALVIFAITWVFLAPVVDETFYRGNLISLESKSLLILTCCASILLFAIKNAYTGWGIFLAIMWGVPLTWSFIKTRNFYVTMTAHFIVNLIGNIPVIFNILKSLN